MLACCLQEEETAREFAECAPFPMWVSNVFGDRTYFNRCWSRLTGMTWESAKNEGWLENVYPEDLGFLRRDLQESPNRCHSHHRSYRLRIASGSYIRIHEIAFPRFDSEGDLVGFLGICLEKQILGSAIRNLNRLEHEEKEIAHALAHDLRAPLRAIEGFSDALFEDFGEDLDEVGLDYLKQISHGARRMQNLIRDLVLYSRLGKEMFGLSPFGSREVIEEAIDRLDDRVLATGAEIELAGEFPILEGHRRTFGLVFENLIDNSLKFVSEGTFPRIRIEALPEPGCCIFLVSDNGIGIPEEFHEEVFGLFRRLHLEREYPGSGTGLTLARKAVELHSGEIRIVSRCGPGVTFGIRIPRRPHSDGDRN